MIEKGYGFIMVPGRQKDLFFHANEYLGDENNLFTHLREGDKVKFEEVGVTGKGEIAIGVSLF